MKKHLLFVLLMMFAASAAAQQKAHKTKVEDHPMLGCSEGKATYQYYETDEGEWIKDGSYHLTGSNTERNPVGGQSSFSIDIQGTYKDGLMHGTWTFTVTAVDLGQRTAPRFSFTKKMVLNYSEGIPNGTWSYTVSPQKVREILIASRYPLVYKWGPTKTLNDLAGSMTVTFNKGVIRSINAAFPKEKLVGRFTADGGPDGEWNFTASSGREGKIRFDRGFYISDHSNKDSQFHKQGLTAEQQSILASYLDGKIDEEGLADSGYITERQKMVLLYDYTCYYKFYEAFYNEDFYRDHLNGDLSAPKDELFGFYNALKPIWYRDWSPRYYNNFTRCKEEYEKDLKAMDIRKEDKVRIREELEKVERELALRPQKDSMLRAIATAKDELKPIVRNQEATTAYKHHISTLEDPTKENSKKISIDFPPYMIYPYGDFYKKLAERIDYKVQKLDRWIVQRNRDYDPDSYTYEQLQGICALEHTRVMDYKKLDMTEDLEYAALFSKFYGECTRTTSGGSTEEFGRLPFFGTALRFISSKLTYNAPYPYNLAYCLLDAAYKINGDAKELKKLHRTQSKNPEALVRWLLAQNDNRGIELLDAFLSEKAR